jgi:hypothetical protein
MYALLNIKTNRFFRIENEYRNCIEVDTFVEALTFKTKKDAYYKSSFLKEEYCIIDIDEARRLNKLS